jgi:hypothetical protein
MPIEATPLEQEVVAFAVTWTDVPTVVLLVGEVTATVANAGTAQPKNNIKRTKTFIHTNLAVGGGRLFLGECRGVLALAI